VTVLNSQLEDNVSFVRSRNRIKYGNELYLKTAKCYAAWIQLAHVASNSTSPKHGNETSGFTQGGVGSKKFAVSSVYSFFVFLSSACVTETNIRVNMRMYRHTAALDGSENDVNV
jgi:hypothetical protein